MPRNVFLIDPNDLESSPYYKEKKMTTLSISEAPPSLETQAASRAAASTFTRAFPLSSPFANGEWEPAQPGLWPARWISHPSSAQSPIVVAYKLEFSLKEEAQFRLHLTADERYELFLDGELVGRGPERGDQENWFFESYDVVLAAGQHTFVARVLSLGEKAPYAQLSVRHGFFLCPENNELLPTLGTGSAPWQCKLLGGYGWQPPLSAWGSGWNQIIDGAHFDWGHEIGSGSGWHDACEGSFGDSGEGVRSASYHKTTEVHHRLRPAMLPAMLDRPRHVGTVRHVAPFADRPVGLAPIHSADSLSGEWGHWERLVTGKGAITIPPYTKRRVVIDLEDYYCARAALKVSGGKGASIEVDWSEALYSDFDDPESCKQRVWAKGNRDIIEGKFLICPWNRQDGPGDIYLPDGGANRAFSPFWWQAGRYVQIVVQTEKDALCIEDFHLRETRYPLEMEGRFTSSDPRIEGLIPLMARGVQMCAHESYMDCPFYEQLMYIGDTRLEVLATYVMSVDDALPRKAIRLFDWSRLFSGLTPSRYPARVRQIIPPFSFWWVAMCHDYALWRGDPDFTKSLLPGVRSVCDYFANLLNEEGLLEAANGWNFMDWTAGKWPHGTPPGGGNAGGISGLLNWHAAWMFRLAGELEEWFGEPEIASLQHRRARRIADATHKRFWNESRGLYADDLAHQHWSEHSQCLALLSGFTPAACVDRIGKGLLEADDLVRTSIYFSYYLFEAYRMLGRVDAFFDRLKLWEQLLENGLKTPLESPEPARSDCHGWGAHPLIHFYTTIAGIRPASPGFKTVEVAPQLGSLEWVKGVLPHPMGKITFSLKPGAYEVTLPDGIKRSR